MPGPALYDPAQILMTFLGTPIIGYADDTFVEVERNEDAFTLHVGSDGETARSRSQNRSGTITFTLMQTSPSNDVLSAAAAADERTGTGIGPCFIKDNGGRSLVNAPNTWVRKLPTMGFAKQAGTRSWTLESDNIDALVGGN